MSSQSQEQQGDSPASPSQQSSRDRIAAAVQARLYGGGVGGSAEGGPSSSSPSLQEASRRKRDEEELLLKLRRVVDLQIRRDNNYANAAECLRTLSMLISNILQNPADPKYRSFKSQNARIQRTVLSLSGGQAYLLLAGFGTRTTDFKQEWFVSTAVQPVAGETPSQLQDFRWRKLELAHRVLRERLADSEDRAQREVERKQREEDFEKNRARRALDEAREDRDRVALRAERESLARRLAAEKEAKKSNSRDAESGAQPRDDGDGVYSGDSQQQQQPPESSGITQDDYTREIPFDEPSHRASGAEGDEEEADSGGEAPPPYGREHLGSGRRLGGP